MAKDTKLPLLACLSGGRVPSRSPAEVIATSGVDQAYKCTTLETQTSNRWPLVSLLHSRWSAQLPCAQDCQCPRQLSQQVRCIALGSDRLVPAGHGSALAAMRLQPSAPVTRAHTARSMRRASILCSTPAAWALARHSAAPIPQLWLPVAVFSSSATGPAVSESGHTRRAS